MDEEKEPTGDEVWQLMALEIGTAWKLEYHVLREGSSAGLSSLLWRCVPHLTESAVVSKQEIAKFKALKSYRYYYDGDKYVDFGKDDVLKVNELTPRCGHDVCTPVVSIRTVMAQTLRQVDIFCAKADRSRSLCAAYPTQLAVRTDDSKMYIECFEWRDKDQNGTDLSWKMAPLLLRNFGESRAYRIEIPYANMTSFKVLFGSSSTNGNSFDSATQEKEPLVKLLLETKGPLGFAVRRLRPLQRFDGFWIAIPDWTETQSLSRQETQEENTLVLSAEKREIEQIAALLYEFDPDLYKNKTNLITINEINTSKTNVNAWHGETTLNNACLVRAVRENRLDLCDTDATYYLGDCVDCGEPLECSINNLDPLALACKKCPSGGRGPQPPPDATPPNFSAWDGQTCENEYKLAQDQVQRIKNHHVRDTFRAYLEKIPPAPPIDHQDDEVQITAEDDGTDEYDYFERLLNHNGLETVPTSDDYLDLAVNVLAGNEENEEKFPEQLRGMSMETLSMRDRMRQDTRQPATVVTDHSNFSKLPASATRNEQDDFTIPDALLQGLEAISLQEVEKAFLDSPLTPHTVLGETHQNTAHSRFHPEFASEFISDSTAASTHMSPTALKVAAGD